MAIETSVDHLRLKFPKEKGMLFKDLSVSFEKGEKVLLLGPSGCGKSTLLQALSGLIPSAIEVPIKYNEIHIPESWGFVFQDPDSQFCMPFVDEEIAFVLENLQVPRSEMKGKITELLNTVGLELDDIHTEIQSLSGGMKQRLAIASVLALNPDVLFLDEPTALIDEQGTSQVWDTIKEVSDEKTVIIVEHKIDQILDFVDRVIVFDPYGEIIADGNVHQVFSKYKDTLHQFGIWYPGVWENHVFDDRKNSEPNIDVMEQNTLILENFKGYRKKEVMVSFDQASASSGEWIAVIGENGAGKSTLLLSLMQLLKTTGKYHINDTQIKGIKDLQNKAYFVFQNPEYQFVTNTVYDELAFALKHQKADADYMNQRVTELLSVFGLSDKKNHHPYHLSLGQKRRLSVATAFIQNPKILLLDEPTFGQDSKNTFRLLEFLEKEQQKGTIIVMVTHDSNIVKHYATSVWEIKNRAVYKMDLSRSEEIACMNH
ncbi:ABC transporter ATP-binding protein [Bacillus sp. NEB1478]|uniref:ABC transporter ATP-binding protein n=1 Tax=Bacillus sp. NEB1478 TaxID=3073816 RepID=UPI0028735815|nr:ABC transporter ATP-binding protein [Bacillus sp. NEB1478]WNB93872.1 ABC transporter ATP-binding protein [Bacillus sp. NEB1478]